MSARFFARWKDRANQVKTQLYTLYLAAKDPRVPWYAKALVAMTVSYALNPLDLIPDFIPVLGYLDDIVLIPLAITLAIRMIPPEVMAESRMKAKIALSRGSVITWPATLMIALLWMVLPAVIVWKIFTG
jgi:uncharacterized membrane protein YkvA (DUF1232 family)